MNKDPKTGGKMGGATVPATCDDKCPLDDSILWASNTADVCGLAVGADGLVALHHDSVEGVSVDGRSLWTAPLALAAGAVGRSDYGEAVRGDAFGRSCGLPG